jgi:hypothetical protein
MQGRALDGLWTDCRLPSIGQTIYPNKNSILLLRLHHRIRVISSPRGALQASRSPDVASASPVPGKQVPNMWLISRASLRRLS